MKLHKFKDFKYIDGGVCAAKGFLANGIHCGIARKALTSSEENNQKANAVSETKKKNDLAVIYSKEYCNTVAVYTTNKVKGAPILVTKENIRDGLAKAVIVNSVNANTCNADGIEKAKKMCEITANQLKISADDVIVASTGVIGQVLPIEPIEKGMEELVNGLSDKGNKSALEAIMTTDTMEKEIAVEFQLGGKKCTMGGMLKGSGMIHPNMATTLTFITTDVKIKTEFLQMALDDVVKTTLNRVSVDGDTSTNDMVSVMASGLAGNDEIRGENDDYLQFKNALYIVLMNLGKMMARDGEGATKLIECICTGANCEKTAEVVAKSVITSSLFKAAMFGEDANWGRILCAIGYADAEFDIDEVDVSISSDAGKIDVCKDGAGLDFSEDEAKKILMEEEIKIIISIGDGESKAIAWGCDLTYDYVRINGDYRS
ncbi:MAG TPA: bifunctional glutamate N-acetyltransferase/amino-acid acetyltransferase ArgJ [Clostridiales bacterium]|nr:bifunctional glutamate N-acetyltransferase/amino-acid acetyltransferase ArgJ [Clostridiales bacterium]